MINIVESIVGRSVLLPKMLEFVARKVSASSGDARKMMEIVTNAIVACRKQLTANFLTSNFNGPLVNLTHAMAAIREANRKYTLLINSLTTYEKAALCAGVNLSRMLGSKPLKLGMLLDYSLMLLGIDHHSDDFITMEDFKEIVERLVDWDLIRLVNFDQSSLSMSRLSQLSITFDLQLEDVESALESSLKYDAVYKRMVKKITSIKW